MNVNLVMLKKDGTTKSFALPSTVTSIGRRQDCDFCLPLSVISRKHCELSLDRNQINIRDLGSRNGTFLNGQRIDETRAGTGDLLEVGPVKFVIQVDGQPASFENYVPESEQEEPEKTAVQAADENAAPGSSETTEILDSLPDDFDLESDIENQLGKEA